MLGVNPPAAPAIQAQLQRILASREFASSPRLRRFLSFVVDRALAGRPHEIKEVVIGVEVYERTGEYDPKTDATVRVEASRLRSKLREYYSGSGQNEAILISIPTGSYVPSFDIRAATAAIPAAASRTNNRAALWLAVAIAMVIAVTLALYMTRGGPEDAQPIPVTALPGTEAYPALSPDGKHVAFSWTGGEETPGNIDVYIKQVDGNALVRLTSDPAPDVAPAWSPDGTQIAFVRGLDVLALPAIGGRERRLFTRRSRGPGAIAWATDGQAILYSDREQQEDASSPAAIYEFSLNTARVQRLTSPPQGSLGDVGPAISPDGRCLAYHRLNNTSSRELRLRSADGDDRKIESGTFVGLAWLSNSEIVFGSSMMYGEYHQGVDRLWRLRIANGHTGKPQWIRAAGEDVGFPTVGGRSADGARLLFQKRTRDSNLWRCEIENGRLTAARRIAVSTRQELAPQFSPAGDRIAFVSDRTGNQELWVADADGKHELQLTFFKDYVVNLPSWSPDGRTIIFNSRKETANNHLFVIGADGGVPRRITSTGSNDAWPGWSRDGRSIYFSSDRSGSEQIWVMSSTGANARQLTKGGGFQPVEAADKRVLFFRMTESRLYSIDPLSGEEQPLLPSGSFPWAVTADGVLFLERSQNAGPRALKLYRFADKRTQTIGPVDLGPGIIPTELSASHDGVRLVLSARERANVDLAMLSRFR